MTNSTMVRFLVRLKTTIFKRKCTEKATFVFSFNLHYCPCSVPHTDICRIGLLSSQEEFSTDLSLDLDISLILCPCNMEELQLHAGVLEALRNTFRDEKHLSQILKVLMSPPDYTTVRFDQNEIDDSTALEILCSLLSKQCQETKRENFDLFQHPVLSDSIVIKNRGPFCVTPVDKEVIVDMACGMAVLRGAHVYKQGIMGAPHYLKVGDIVSVYADLEGHCLKGLASKYEGSKVHVGNGIAQVTRADLYSAKDDPSSGIGILMSQPIYEAPSLADISLSWVFFQNLPSIVCVHTLNPEPGEVILDMCAAPGGKTLHIASLMKNQGRIIALEKSKERARKMKKLKITCLEIYGCDSITAVCPETDRECDTAHHNSESDGAPPYPPSSFDRILVDAPCSALGQRPCYTNKMSIKQLKSFPIIQHKLLLAAAELVKPGGVVVYSTCTITREENEDQVSRLLAKCPSMELVSPPYKLGGDGLPDCDLTDEQRSKVQRFDPSVLYSDDTDSQESYNVDTIGFFIAKFCKNKTDYGI